MSVPLDDTIRYHSPSAGRWGVGALRASAAKPMCAGGVALVGCGDGSIHAVHISQGETLYALGAHKVRGNAEPACGLMLW